jgi:Calx-beta domain./F5/8 type C domain.
MKTKNNLRTFIAATAAVFALSCAGAFAQYAQIPYSTSMVASAANSFDANRVPLKTLNGAGLDSKNCHSTNAVDMWMGPQTPAQRWFRVDLGAEYPLAAIKIWNFNMNNGSSFASRGPNSIDIFVSTDAASPTVGGTDYNAYINWGWTPLFRNRTLGMATGNATYAGEPLIEFAPVQARWVVFKINSLHSGNMDYAGLSEVQFFVGGKPIVTLDSIDITSTSSLNFNGELLSAGLESDAVIVSCYGTEDGGQDFDAWDVVTEHGVFNEGALFSDVLSNLVPNNGYYFNIAATNAEIGWASLAPFTFITGPVTVAAPADFYESQVAPALIKFQRPITSTNVPLTVTYQVSGTAAAGAHYQPLSGTVTFDVGVSEVTQPITAIDNNSAIDRTVTITLDAGGFLATPAAATFTILGRNGAGQTITWDGSANDNNWHTPENWTPAQVPAAPDDVVFGAAGIYANSKIIVDESVQVNTISITATENFAIGTNSAVSLAASKINLDAAEKTLDFGAQVIAVAHMPATSVWNVVAGTLRINGGTSTPAGVNLLKTGAGSIRWEAGTLHTGTTIIAEGAVTCNTEYLYLRGNLVVGTPDGTVPAKYTTMSGDHSGGMPSDKYVTVYANGTFYQGDFPGIAGLTIYGGTVNGNWPNINGTITMRGGRLTATPSQGSCIKIATLPCETNAIISATKQWDGYSNSNFTYEIADGLAPIDLKNIGSIYSDSATRSFIKTGDGVMQLTSNGSAFNRMNFHIRGGAVLVDNTANSGTGNASVLVESGATLGGIGYIGGVLSASNAVVTVTGSAASPATIAPGTIDETTGEHIIGALTIGSTNQVNNIAFNDNSRLTANLGANYANDLLNIHGAATISATGTILDVSSSPDAEEGFYTLLRASAGITGQFATVIFNGKPAKSNFFIYTATEVIFTIPQRVTLLLVR